MTFFYYFLIFNLSPEKAALHRLSSILFTLTPGYCRAYFGRLRTSPLFDKKKRGFVKQNIPLKNTINFLSQTPLSFFPKRGAGGEFGKFEIL
ncbi:MAG: hypothetical protein CVV49_15455 [Spirochaetae bacterium HGW-Spirochaetae-5]|nr:MAG: hypothetical protein CVV49_15455 [Spirochaetae bacterium HGW-Spirochaetae-5]